MSTLKGVPIICTQEMAEEALKSRLAQFSAKPTLKTRLPLQCTEWRLTKLIHTVVPHFSSNIYMHSKKWVF